MDTKDLAIKEVQRNPIKADEKDKYTFVLVGGTFAILMFSVCKIRMKLGFNGDYSALSQSRSGHNKTL